jgi:mono/diheme cytochrome c family protein
LNVIRLALVAVLAASAAVAGRESGTPKYDAAAIARGRYLAHAVGECFECHSPLYDDDRVLPIAGKLGAGDILNEKTRLVAPNITPDPLSALPAPARARGAEPYALKERVRPKPRGSEDPVDN